MPEYTFLTQRVETMTLDEQELIDKIQNEIKEYLDFSGQLKPDDPHQKEISGMISAYVQILKWMGVVKTIEKD